MVRSAVNGKSFPFPRGVGGGEMGRGTNVLAHFPRYMGDEPADGAAVSILESERRPAQY